jgi:hypothetical protein
MIHIRRFQKGIIACVCLVAQLGLAQTQIESIISLAAEPIYTQRHHQLHQLSSAALEGGAEELIAFMRAEQVPEGMREDEYMSIVNDIYNLLLTNGTEVQQLFDLGLEVIPNELAGQIWRDYCVQKLGYTLGREDIAPDSIQRALALLDRATQGAYPALQGTALVVAYQHKDHPFNPKPAFLETQVLGERALAAAQDPSKPLIDRITGLQTAAKVGAVGTLEYAVAMLAQTEQGEPMLKVVSLAVVGQLGSESQIPLLAEYRLSPDTRLRKAARSALQKLQGQS